MIKPSPEMWPVLARWRQQTDDGSNTWHLAGLRADGGFWGYVHFRTQSQQENRSFEGTLDAETFERVSDLIQKVARYGKNDIQHKPLVGLIGVGTRFSFRGIFGVRDEVAEPDRPSVVRVYRELIVLIQPVLAANIIQ